MSAASAVTSSLRGVPGDPDPSLSWHPVLGMLRPPPVEHLDRPVVPADGEAHVVDGVACLDLGEEARRVVEERRGAVEVAVYLAEESDRFHPEPAKG